MTERKPDLDSRSLVVVPARPGALLRLDEVDRGRDEIDEALDDLFGAPDDRGPGPVDAVLVVGGLGAAVAGLAASLPVLVTVGGFGAFALGAVLPARSVWRRFGTVRREARVRSLTGDGVLLRVDHPSVSRLVAVHHALLEAGATLASAPALRLGEVAHSAVLEVATLLDGRPPVGDEQVRYIDDRSRALDELARAVADAAVGGGDPDRERARLLAQREVEQLSGSSLTGAADLADELRGDRGD